MQFARYLGLVALVSLPTLKAADQPVAKAPSSDIPDRREFPVNPNINPCENFYEYACSSVISSFKLRDDRSTHTFSFSDSRERLIASKKAFLKELEQKQKAKDTLNERSNTIASVYGACMNVEARKKEEKALVEETIKKLNAIKDRKAFLNFLAEQRRGGYDSFVSFDHQANQDRPEIYDFYFFVNLMVLPERSYYLSKEVSADYQNLLQDFFKSVNFGDPKANAKSVLNLETEFAKVKPLPAEMRQIYSQRGNISRADLLKKYPSFVLDKELEQVPDSILIRHLVPDTYAAAEKTLKTAPLNELKALYLYQFLEGVLDDAYPEYFAKSFAFKQKHLGAPPVRPDREERCTELVMQSFAKEIDVELLPRIFPDFPEQKFIELAERMRGSIIDGVKASTWLSEEGKKGAIEKITKAKLQLVKPQTEDDWYFNPKQSYSLEAPLNNEFLLNKALNQRTLEEFQGPRNRTRWSMGPLTVNAYYNMTDNKFVMPIGILQYPFYDPKLTVEENLGAVGTVIGHELGHGIDDRGAKYDAEGKLRQWMSDNDVKSFQERGKRFIDQYEKTGHNGALTLGENIGDLTGLTSSYRAAFPEGKGSQTQKQAFFLQYARLWCGTELPKYAEKKKKTDSHALGWARTNEQIKNQPDFAEVYACKASDSMVLPRDQVIKIW